MLVKQISGYMLGNAMHAPEKGQAWCTYDVPVYFCANVDVAKKILFQSHKQCALEPNCIWTTIYQVHANDVNVKEMGDDIYWTNQATKLIVDKPVFYAQPRRLNEQELLIQARRIMPGVIKLINNAREEER